MCTWGESLRVERATRTASPSAPCTLSSCRAASPSPSPKPNPVSPNLGPAEWRLLSRAYTDPGEGQNHSAQKMERNREGKMNAYGQNSSKKRSTRKKGQDDNWVYDSNCLILFSKLCGFCGRPLLSY